MRRVCGLEEWRRDSLTSFRFHGDDWRLERLKIHYVFNACDSMVLEFWIIDKSTMTKVFQIRRQTRKRLRNWLKLWLLFPRRLSFWWWWWRPRVLFRYADCRPKICFVSLFARTPASVLSVLLRGQNGMYIILPFFSSFFFFALLLPPGFSLVRVNGRLDLLRTSIDSSSGPSVASGHTIRSFYTASSCWPAAGPICSCLIFITFSTDFSFLSFFKILLYIISVPIQS